MFEAVVRNRAREAFVAWLKDAGERVASTAAAAGVGEAIVLAADLPQWAAVPVVTGLTAVKTWLARYKGSKSSAGFVDGRDAR